MQWKSAECQHLRVIYKNWQGVNRTNTADFLVEGRYLVEIKPVKLHSSKTVQDKAKAARKFCKKHGYKYQLMDCQPLTNAELLVLYKNNDIKLTDKYEKLFIEKYLSNAT